jgi:acyl phosphate:glycerol-3-phosphate acyltransferase
MLQIILALSLGYAIGSFPSAFLIGKLKGENIFKVGSGNMGAMNTARNLGYGLGVLVLVLDLGKGALATYLGLRLFPLDTLPALIAGAAAVLGHAWSMYIGFKGGKGLATTFGVALPLYPIGGFIALGVLILLIMLLKKVNLASLVLTILYPFITGFTAYWQQLPTNQVLGIIFSSLGIAIIVAVKHLPSLKKSQATP